MNELSFLNDSIVDQDILAALDSLCAITPDQDETHEDDLADLITE